MSRLMEFMFNENITLKIHKLILKLWAFTFWTEIPSTLLYLQYSTQVPNDSIPNIKKHFLGTNSAFYN